MKCEILSFTKCVLDYSKLINLFGKKHSGSEQLFKWPTKSPFSLATLHLHEDSDQIGNQIQLASQISTFRQFLPDKIAFLPDKIAYDTIQDTM